MAIYSLIMFGLILVSDLMLLVTCHHLNRSDQLQSSMLAKYDDLLERCHEDCFLSHKVTDAFIDSTQILARQYKTLCSLVMDTPLSDEAKENIRRTLEESWEDETLPLGGDE